MFLLDPPGDSQRRGQRARTLAKAAVLLACAGSTDAFHTSLGLRSFAPATKSLGSVSHQANPIVSLRQRTERPAVLGGLRAAAAPAAPTKDEAKPVLCPEEMYELAQVRASFLPPFSSLTSLLRVLTPSCVCVHVQTNFEDWNSSLRARDFEKAASFYSNDDLSFLPTVSSDFIRDKDSTRKYFADFVC